VSGRAFRLFLGLGLTLNLFVVTLGPSRAESLEGPTTLYFPWVPNGINLGELGPSFGTVTMQNLESEDITVYYESSLDGDWARRVDPAGFGTVEE
jgi:hypothetical protein